VSVLANNRRAGGAYQGWIARYVDVEMGEWVEVSPPHHAAPQSGHWTLNPPSSSRRAKSGTLSPRDTRHAEKASRTHTEPGLTLPMTALPQDHGAVKSYRVEKQAAMASRTPVLAHRMKHDKSILALVVSSQYIFAGTQGGEILVGRARDMG
jgi:hypothetical protein